MLKQPCIQGRCVVADAATGEFEARSLEGTLRAMALKTVIGFRAFATVACSTPCRFASLGSEPEERFVRGL
jgi:hypothetical protein